MVTKRPYFVVGPDLQWGMSLGGRAIKLVSPDWCPITIVKSQQLSFKIGYMNSSDYTYDRVPVQHDNGHDNDMSYCEITHGHVWSDISYGRGNTGRFDIKTSSYLHICILIIKIRRSHDLLIFKMQIPYLERPSIYWDGVPAVSELIVDFCWKPV